MTGAHGGARSAPPLTDWYALFSDRPSPFAEDIYRRFIDRLREYAGTSLNDEYLRQQAIRYLFPTVHLLKSPFAIPGMLAAVGQLRAFLAEKENTARRLVIYGDRDADGVTSAALITLFCKEQLKLTASELVTLVPREEDKYGITPAVAARIIAEKPTLLVTLDCGSSNKAELSQITAATGCRTIIIDHHFIPASPADYPEVDAFINPKLLPEPDISKLLESTYVAPVDDIEKQLVEIWKTQLGIEKIGTNDNFFQIGGHSILATKVVSQINNTFSINLPIRSIFEFTTIKELAAYIKLLILPTQNVSKSESFTL